VAKAALFLFFVFLRARARSFFQTSPKVALWVVVVLLPSWMLVRMMMLYMLMTERNRRLKVALA